MFCDESKRSIYKRSAENSEWMYYCLDRMKTRQVRVRLGLYRNDSDTPQTVFWYFTTRLRFCFDTNNARLFTGVNYCISFTLITKMRFLYFPKYDTFYDLFLSRNTCYSIIGTNGKKTRTNLWICELCQTISKFILFTQNNINLHTSFKHGLIIS